MPGSDAEVIVQAVQSILALLPNDPGVRADRLGLLMRLAYHDAGGLTGGANGCVDLTHSSNAGLQEAIDLLAPTVAAASKVLSRADVWALASNVAIQSSGGPPVEFRKGRLDLASCIGDGWGHLDAERDHTHIRQVFVQRLGFSERETAALMGAHVLGRVVRANSGYNGKWVPMNDRFTNAYFTDLIDRPWRRQQQPNFKGRTRFQWNGRGDTMMQNTDIEMAFDTSGGCVVAGGRGQGCPRAAHGFSDAVTEFSENEDTFFTTFALAHAKLTALGTAGLECALADCSTPTR